MTRGCSLIRSLTRWLDPLRKRRGGLLKKREGVIVLRFMMNWVVNLENRQCTTKGERVKQIRMLNAPPRQMTAQCPGTWSLTKSATGLCASGIGMCEWLQRGMENCKLRETVCYRARLAMERAPCRNGSLRCFFKKMGKTAFSQGTKVNTLVPLESKGGEEERQHHFRAQLFIRLETSLRPSSGGAHL